MSIDDRQEMELKDIGELKTSIMEIRVALIGMDGNNGLRGELREFEKNTAKHLSAQDEKLSIVSEWKNDIESRFATYIKHGRAVDCFGLKAVKELREELANEEQTRTEGRRASDTMVTELKKQRLVMFAAIAVALISTLGTLGAATIYANKPAPIGIQTPKAIGE